MKKETISRITLAFVLFVAAALGATAIQAATELAQVNGSVITLQQFEKSYRESLKFFHNKAPNKKALLNEMVNRELGIQQAKKMGLARDPKVIHQMDTVLYQAYLKHMLAKQFDTIQVTDQQAKDWYERNPEIRTSQIFVAVRPNAKPADVLKAKREIADIYSKYVRPGHMSFAQVARKYSEGADAAMGGDLGWQTREQMDPSYYAAAVRLHVGGVSGIVRSQFGFHIIRLTGKRGWNQVDRPMIKRIVFDQRRQQIYEAFMNRLRSHAHIVIHSELLKN